MKITLVAGKAHLKHTEGGDFRQATYRAVRQGLRKARSVLLEPVYEYRLEVPSDMVGRAMTDIQKMYGTFQGPEIEGEMSVLTGVAPVVTMGGYQSEVTAYTRGRGRLSCTLKGYQPCHNAEEVIEAAGYEPDADMENPGYQSEVTAYTRGRGRLSCTLKGYQPCHNAEEVIEAAGYEPDADMENPTGSVFCAHGAGFVVNWDEVDTYAHIQTELGLEETDIWRTPQVRYFVHTEQDLW